MEQTLFLGHHFRDSPRRLLFERAMLHRPFLPYLPPLKHVFCHGVDNGKFTDEKYS